MTLSLRSPLEQTLMCGMAVAVALCCLFSFAPKAHAQSLTEGQIQAILGLLVSFDVDSETVGTVNAILHGDDRAPAPAGEVLGASTLSDDALTSKKNTTVILGGASVSVPSGTETLVPDDYVPPQSTHDLPQGLDYDGLNFDSLDIAGFLQGLGINQVAPGAAPRGVLVNSDLPPLPSVTRASSNASAFKQLYRYVSVVNGVNVYQDSTSNVSGWTRGTALGYIAPSSIAGTSMLRSCVYTAINPLNGEKVHNYLSTVLSACPKVASVTVEDKGALGYAWTSPASYLAGVYTCLHPIGIGGAQVSYSTLSPTCDSALDSVQNNGRPAYYLSKGATLEPVVSIDVSPSQVQSGDGATVTWQAQNVASCAITSGTSTLATGLKGKKSTGDLTKTTVFNLACAKLDQGYARASKTVVVSALVDTTAPKLSIASPHNNQVVRGTVYISANASDPSVKKQSTSGIKQVALMVDGRTVSQSSAAPYGFVWDTSNVATGTHTIAATALDNAGNTQTVTSSVTVNHTPEPMLLNPLSRYKYDYRYFVERMSLPSADETVHLPGAPTYTRVAAIGYVASTDGGSSNLSKLSACLVEYNGKYHLKDVYSTTNGCTLGGSNQGTLGYVWKTADDSRAPLYRCTATGSYDPWWDLFGWYEVHFVDRYDATSGWCGATPQPLRGPQIPNTFCNATYVGGDGYPATLMCASGGGGENTPVYSPLPDCKSLQVPAGWQYNDLVIDTQYQGEGVSAYNVSCYPFKKVSAEEYYKTLGLPMPGKLLGYVSKTKAVPVELSLTVATSTVIYGATPQVKWSAPAAASCKLTLNQKPFSTTNATFGLKDTPALTDTSVVRLTCTDTAGKSVATSTTITVLQPDQASCDLTATPKKITKGESTMLSWTVDGAVDGRIDHAVGTTSPLKQGSVTISPGTTTVYTLTVHNKAGIKGTCSATATVSADTAAPKISFSSPQNNAQVAATTTITVTLHDNVDVARVILLDGTTVIRSANPAKPASGVDIPTFSYVWNTAKVENGAHTLSAVARDAAGNAATTTITINVLNVKPPQLSIDAMPNPIGAGAFSVITWSAKNVTQCSVFKDASTVALWTGVEGTQPTGQLTATTTYTLSCGTVLGSTTTKSVTIGVRTGTPLLSLSAKPTSIDSGASSTITWSAKNVSICALLKNGNVSEPVSIEASGKQSTGPLIMSTTYTLGCQGYDGSTPFKSVTVVVLGTPPVPTPKLSIRAKPVSVTSGGASTISWSASDVTSCGIFKNGNLSAIVPVAISGSTSTGALTTPTTYTLGCTDLAGVPTTTSATVIVGGASVSPAKIAISVSPKTVARGASATIKWAGKNVSQCAIIKNGDLSSAVQVSASGTSSTGALTTQTTYTFGCTDLSGIPTSTSATVSIKAAPPAAPSLSLSASPSSVASGGSATLTWSAQNVVQCGIFKGVSLTPIASGLSGSKSTGALTSTTAFALECVTATRDTVSKQVIVRISAPPPPGSSDSFDPAAYTAAVVASPYNFAVDALTDLFVAMGVGDSQSLVEQTLAFAGDYSQAFNENLQAVLMAPYDTAVSALTAALANATDDNTSSSSALSLKVSDKGGYALAAGGSTGVTIGQYILHSNSAFMLTRIGLALTSGSPYDVVQVYLYNGSQLIGTAQFPGTSTSTTIVIDPVSVTPGDTTASDVVLTLKADLAQIGVASPGKSGDLITIDPKTFQGVVGDNIVVGKATGHVAGVRLFRTYPTVSVNSGSCTESDSCEGASMSLLGFSITANAAGPVGIRTISISTKSYSAEVDNGVLAIYDGENPKGFMGATCSRPDKTVCTFTAATPVEIPAGKTYNFGFYADVAPSSSDTTWSVSAALIGDAKYRQLSTPKAADKFVWSPNSTTTATYQSADWTNGYGIIAAENISTSTPGIITVSAPKEGQALKAGKQFVIRWSAKDMPADARLYISIMNGTSGTANDPNKTIASNVSMGTTTYVWTVTPNDGSWGVGMASPAQKIAALLGIPTAQAASNKYVIGVRAVKNGSEIAYGKSGVFTISAPTSTKPIFTAEPKKGPAPLDVTFTATGINVINSDLIVNFGDGKSAIIEKDLCRDEACFTASHTYDKAGTYTASLVRKGSCRTDAAQACGTSDMLIGSATIKVSAGTSTAPVVFSARPVVGPSPLKVTFKAKNLQSTGIYSLSYGEGDTVLLCDQDKGGVSSCGASWAGPHTYQTPGTYNAALYYQISCAPGVACSHAIMQVGTVAVKVTEPARAALNITVSSSTVTWSAKNVQNGSCVVTWNNGEGERFFGNDSNGSDTTPMSRIDSSATFILTCTDLEGRKVKVSAKIQATPTPPILQGAAVLLTAPYSIAVDALSDIFLATGLVQ